MTRQRLPTILMTTSAAGHQAWMDFPELGARPHLENLTTFAKCDDLDPDRAILNSALERISYGDGQEPSA